MNTLERTKRVVADCLGEDVGDIKPESRLMQDLGAQSLELLELAFLLEQEFGVPLEVDELIPDARQHGREMLERLTVADIVAILDGKLGDQ
jgi:acyl carrier protein